MELKQIVGKKSIFETALRRHPALPPLYLFLSTSLPLSLLEFGYISKTASFISAIIFPILGWQLVPPTYKSSVLMALLGCLATYLHIRAPWASYRNYLPREEVYAEVKAIVTDGRIVKSESLDDFEKHKSIEILVQELRLSRFEKWQKCRGKIYLLNPENDVEYGAKLLLKGSFLLPFENDLPGLFNYRKYLKSKGILHVFKAAEVRVQQKQASERRRGVSKLIRLRENILNRIVRYIEGDDDRGILAAMTLGFRQSLSTDKRDLFIKSGTIHILAISGLHLDISYF